MLIKPLISKSLQLISTTLQCRTALDSLRRIAWHGIAGAPEFLNFTITARWCIQSTANQSMCSYSHFLKNNYSLLLLRFIGICLMMKSLQTDPVLIAIIHIYYIVGVNHDFSNRSSAQVTSTPPPPQLQQLQWISFSLTGAQVQHQQQQQQRQSDRVIVQMLHHVHFRRMGIH